MHGWWLKHHACVHEKSIKNVNNKLLFTIETTLWCQTGKSIVQHYKLGTVVWPVLGT